MKSLHVFSIVLLTSGTAFAQHNNLLKNHIQNTPQRQIVQMLLPQDQGTAMKSTGVRKRVIAQSSYYGGAITDTAKYYYTNNYQASKYNFNQMDYDNSSYNPVDFPVFSYMSAILSSGSYALGANCDSLKSWSDGGSGLMLSEDQHNGYVNNNVLSDYKDLTYNNGTPSGKHYTNSYDAQGRLTTSIQQSYDTATGTWDTVNRKKISYNAQGRVQNDTVFTYDLGSWVATTAYSYTYDANGNIIQINDNENNGASWILAAQYQNTYTNNRLKTLTYLADTSGGGGQLAPLAVDTFGYTGTSNFYSYWQETYIIDPTFSFPVLQVSRTMNSLGLPDSMNVSAFNGSSISPVETVKMTYDADGNPLTVNVVDIQSGTNGTSTYYYEAFNDATSVANITAAEQFYTVFPNPARDLLHIRRTGNITAATSSVHIINTLGQQVYTGQLSWSQSAPQVNISALQPGAYWISIVDENGKNTGTQSFIKQ